MERRLDPIQIIARPSQHVARDREQVFGAWIHLARKTGWQVTPLDE